MLTLSKRIFCWNYLFISKYRCSHSSRTIDEALKHATKKSVWYGNNSNYYNIENINEYPTQLIDLIDNRNWDESMNILNILMKNNYKLTIDINLFNKIFLSWKNCDNYPFYMSEFIYFFSKYKQYCIKFR